MVATECDVYAPCAVGGVIDAVTVEQLSCRVVAGAANNQLADPALADRLHERGILYAPDFVINSGGVLHGAGLELLGWDDATLEARLRGLGDLLTELYAAADGRSPGPRRRGARGAPAYARSRYPVANSRQVDARTGPRRRAIRNTSESAMFVSE